MIFTDLFGDNIELTDERWLHIVREHPETGQYKDRIKEVLLIPDYVKRSRRDDKVLLYYKWFDDILSGKYCLLVAKKGLRSFILTCYITDSIKKGGTVWEKR